LDVQTRSQLRFSSTGTHRAFTPVFALHFVASRTAAQPVAWADGACSVSSSVSRIEIGHLLLYFRIQQLLGIVIHAQAASSDVTCGSSARTVKTDLLAALGGLLKACLHDERGEGLVELALRMGGPLLLAGVRGQVAATFEGKTYSGERSKHACPSSVTRISACPGIQCTQTDELLQRQSLARHLSGRELERAREPSQPPPTKSYCSCRGSLTLSAFRCEGPLHRGAWRAAAGVRKTRPVDRTGTAYERTTVLYM
jgi:hypothetical protein